ncbi:sialidase family protein [Verrucomicrobiota bacterium sgz303538]
MLLRLPPFIISLVLSCALVSQVHCAAVEIVPSEFHGAMQPQVAIAPAGSVHVVFGKDGSIFHTVSANGSLSFSKPVQIGSLPKLALGMRRGPRVAATDHRICVAAISHEEGNLYTWTSDDAGATWSKPMQINSVAKSAREGLHAMAGDGKGFVILTWLDMRNAGMELWSATSRDGGATWGANTLVYKSPDGHICECCHPSVAISPQGEVAVMWRNWVDGSRDMYLATSKDGGATFSTAQKLGEGTWQLKGCPMDGGAVAYSADGQPATTWRREKTVFATDPGKPEQMLAEAGVQPIIFPGRSGMNLLWQSGSQLLLQRPNQQPLPFAENAAFPAAAATAPAQAPVVVWESTNNGVRTLLADRVE